MAQFGGKGRRAGWLAGVHTGWLVGGPGGGRVGAGAPNIRLYERPSELHLMGLWGISRSEQNIYISLSLSLSLDIGGLWPKTSTWLGVPSLEIGILWPKTFRLWNRPVGEGPAGDRFRTARPSRTAPALPHPPPRPSHHHPPTNRPPLCPRPAEK